MKSGNSGKAKRRAWKSRVIFILIVLLAGGGAGWYFFLGPGAAARMNAAGGDPEFYTTAVKRGDLSISAAGSGKLVAYQSVDLSFPVSGVVTELNVETGDMVKEGQVLAKLSSSRALEASLAEAEVQVLSAQKTLEELQQSGELALAQARSDLVTAQDAYDSALDKSQRIDQPRCSQEVNKRYRAALDRATSKLEKIHAETQYSDVYIAAKKEYDTALANYSYCIAYTEDEKSAALSTLEVARTALETAQDHYETLSAAGGIDPGELAMAEAKRKEAQALKVKVQDYLDGTTLSAPMDGKVTYLAAGVGAMPGTSTFLTIANVSRAALEISVDESDVQKLILNSQVRVVFDALPDQTFAGKVVQVDPQVTQSGEYRVAKGLVELDAAAVKTVADLPLGLSATVMVVNQESINTLLAPTIALRDLGDGTWGVMVQGLDGQLKLQVVSTGIQDDDYTEITAGLEEGDLVSTGTRQFLAAGSTISSDSLKNAQNQGGFPGMPPGGGPVP